MSRETPAGMFLGMPWGSPWKISRGTPWECLSCCLKELSDVKVIMSNVVLIASPHCIRILCHCSKQWLAIIIVNKRKTHVNWLLYIVFFLELTKILWFYYQWHVISTHVKCLWTPTHLLSFLHRRCKDWIKIKKRIMKIFWVVKEETVLNIASR